jgi:CheY-like chemotaxis protein
MAVRPFHLLLVEDNPAHARLAQMAITSGPIPAVVEHVPDGEQALAYLRREPPHENRPRVDLVLLDLKAPKIDGVELLKRMKADPQLRAIPVVVLSSTISRAETENAYQNFANSFLTKPLDFDEFQRMINDLLLYWGTWNEPA